MNIARLRYELDDPRLEDFMNALDRINALADASEGFVWRLQEDEGNATSVRAYDDPRVVLNLSVWTGLEPLKSFAYRGEHLQFLRRRHEWFEVSSAPTLALWWIRAGDCPTPLEARHKLELLTANGPTQDAFSFKDSFASVHRRPTGG